MRPQAFGRVGGPPLHPRSRPRSDRRRLGVVVLLTLLLAGPLAGAVPGEPPAALPTFDPDPITLPIVGEVDLPTLPPDPGNLPLPDPGTPPTVPPLPAPPPVGPPEELPPLPEVEPDPIPLPPLPGVPPLHPGIDDAWYVPSAGVPGEATTPCAQTPAASCASWQALAADARWTSSDIGAPLLVAMGDALVVPIERDDPLRSAVRKLDADTGATLWTSAEFPGSVAALSAATGGTIVVLADDLSTVSLDATTGALRWMTGPMGQRASARGFAVDETERILVTLGWAGQGQQTLVATARDVASGSALWSVALPHGEGHGVAVGGGRAFVVSGATLASPTQHHVTALRLSTGALEWRVTQDGPWAAAPVASPDGARVAVASFERDEGATRRATSVVVLDAASGTSVWERDLSRTLLSSSLSYGFLWTRDGAGLLLAAAPQACFDASFCAALCCTLMRLDAQDGSTMWSAEAPGIRTMRLSLDGERLVTTRITPPLAGAADVQVLAYDARTGGVSGIRSVGFDGRDEDAPTLALADDGTVFVAGRSRMAFASGGDESAFFAALTPAGGAEP